MKDIVEIGRMLTPVEPMGKPEGIVAALEAKEKCPECGGHGGIYLPELGLGPDGECASMQCPTCCPLPEMEDGF